MKILTNVDLNLSELQNAVIQPLASAPSVSSSRLGQIYFNSSDKHLYIFDGTSWVVAGVLVEASNKNGYLKINGVDTKIYELPTATTSSLGAVRIGTGLAIDSATGTISVSNEGMAVGSADKLTAARVISLTGDASGSVSFDGSKDVAIEVTILDDSHNHIISNIDGLQSALDKKVNAVEGKGLSTNDYTTAEKNKLAGIAAGAEVNVNADWNASSGDAQILNKPTALSSFTNDEGFIDNTVSNLANYYLKTETYTQTEINNLIGNIATITISAVDSLPASGQSNVIYLTPKAGGSATNVKDEYLWTGSAFEKIGDTEIDLSNYLTKTGDASNTTVSFTQAASRTNIATGESEAILMGKIAKYFADLKTVAFTGSYNDLSNRPSLVKYENLTLSTSQTSNNKTLSGSAVLSVIVTDSVTKEVVMCDVSISGMKVTVSTASAPKNNLNILIAYI